ncbi:MAG: DNA polymerase III subunit gamma/tau [Pyrinomonadaceae bacterium]
MSYQVIARKWRPQVFEEVTGQDVITQTLRNALEYDRLHHAYLFSGARGVGKTTTARILAKALNCHKTEGKPNLTPCRTDSPDACDSCIEISESRSMDVLEIDAASHTGIDDVRDTIINSIDFNPARDRYKVFIIDEVHQLSKAAFNALLKTLEEPPNNVVFVMATTELHKVPDTILSRCQEFEFRTIPLQKIFDRLKLIADAEKIDIDENALRELARSGEGSMRDAQSNFDQVISFSGEKIEAQDVTNALGFAGVDVLSKAIEAIAGRDTKAVLEIVDDLIARGHDLRNFCRDLLGLFRDLLVAKVARNEKHLFEAAVFSDDDMQRMAAPFTEADLIRFFNSMSETEASLREAAHPRYMLEIGLVKLLEMRSVTSIEDILQKLDALGVSAAAPPEKMSAAALPVSPATQEKKTLNSGSEVKSDGFSRSSTPPALSASPVSPIISPSSVETPKRVTLAPVEPPAVAAPEDVFEGHVEEMFDAPVDLVEPEHMFAPEADDAFAPPAPEFRARELKDLHPVRMPRLSSEELEHVPDDKLDNAYEEKLYFTGDNLFPIKNAERMIAFLQPPEPAKPSSNGYGAATATATATATAPAIDVSHMIADLKLEEEDVPLPELSDDPTEDELLEYARAHPAVRRVMRTFRAKIVKVEKR